MRDKRVVYKVLKHSAECELCGSKKGIEVHHIIPVCLADQLNVDLDVEENMIVLCQKCHSLLTPKGLLTKIGIQRVKGDNKNSEKIERFYQTIDDNVENRLSACDVIDIFEAVFLENEKISV